MERVTAIDNSRAAGRDTGKFDRRLDGLGPGIGEEHLVQIRHKPQQALGQNAGENRYVHLHEIGQFAVEHGIESVANCRMITPDGEHTPPAQKVEILRALLVVQILPDAALVSLIEPNGPEHMDHLLVEMARVQLVSLDFPLGDELSDVKTHASAQLSLVFPSAIPGRDDPSESVVSEFRRQSAWRLGQTGGCLPYPILPRLNRRQ